MSTEFTIDQTRRGALRCLAFGGAGTLFVLSGGVLAPVDLALGATKPTPMAKAGTPLFVQISDTHIGFKADANPDVAGTVKQTIDLVNAMRDKPAFIMHTGDITHLSKPEEFDLAAQLLSGLKVTELHTVPGGDVADLPDAGRSARRIAPAPVHRAHDGAAVERPRPAARLVEIGEKLRAWGSIGPDPTERDADAGRRDTGRSDEVQHGFGGLPLLGRAREVQAAKLDGLPPGLAHDLEHATERRRVERPSMKSESVQH